MKQPSPSTPWTRLVRFYNKDIWQPAWLNDTTWAGRGSALLRVVSITLTGLNSTRATSRAAALAFSSLLGIGPLIGIAVLIAGFAVGSNDSDFVVNKLNDLINYVAPQLNHYEQIKNTQPVNAQAVLAASTTVNPELVTHIRDFINATRSSASGGIASATVLILIVLLLFTSVEQVFNDIWGVRRGRSWILRIVFYWTILTLGAVIFFGALGTLAASNFEKYMQSQLGKNAADILAPALRILGISTLVGVLTLFYRYIPNTRVFWRSAFAGAVVVTTLIGANNLVAAAYFNRVELTSDLYGSLALPMVLMFGLYIFWLVVLVGGQISYAVQNVHYRNSQAAWSSLSESTRERLTLIVLLTIGRRFQACLPPCNVAQLGSTIKVPTQIINEALNRLVDLQFVSPVPSAEENTSSDFHYQPARPLGSITLGEFKEQFENQGDDPAGDSIDRLDPLIEHYHGAIRSLNDQSLFSKSLEALFDAHAFDVSMPPFAFGQKPPAIIAPSR